MSLLKIHTDDIYQVSCGYEGKSDTYEGQSGAGKLKVDEMNVKVESKYDKLHP